MSDHQEHRVVYVSHPASGLARSNFPLVCHVAGSRIVRSLPFQIPDNVRLYEIKTSRGVYTRPGMTGARTVRIPTIGVVAAIPGSVGIGRSTLSRLS
jgi:hypothetical protein